jgi:hypothetical protein
LKWGLLFDERRDVTATGLADRTLFSSKRRAHLKRRKSWKEQKCCHGFRRDTKPRFTVLARASSNIPNPIYQPGFKGSLKAPRAVRHVVDTATIPLEMVNQRVLKQLGNSDTPEKLWLLTDMCL